LWTRWLIVGIAIAALGIAAMLTRGEYDDDRRRSAFVILVVGCLLAFSFAVAIGPDIFSVVRLGLLVITIAWFWMRSRTI